MTDPGLLRVELLDPVGTLPVTIRDPALMLVERTRTGVTLELSAGTYMVEVPLPGRPIHRVAVSIVDGRIALLKVPLLPGPDVGSGEREWLITLTQGADMPVPATRFDRDIVLLDDIGIGPAFVSLQRPPPPPVLLKPRGNLPASGASRWHVTIPVDSRSVRISRASPNVAPRDQGAQWFETAIQFAEHGYLAESCDVLRQFAFDHAAPEPLALLGLLAIKSNDQQLAASAREAARTRPASGDLQAMAAAIVDRSGDLAVAVGLAQSALEAGSTSLTLAVSTVVSLLREVSDPDLGRLAPQRRALRQLAQQAAMNCVLLTVHDSIGDAADSLVAALGIDHPVQRAVESAPAAGSAPSGIARVIPLRFDRLGAAAARGDEVRPAAQQRVPIAPGVVAEFYSATGAAEIGVTVFATGNGWDDTILPITVADGDKPATTYLVALTGDQHGASGRVIAAARSDAPLVSIVLSPRTTDSLTAGDVPAVRRSVAGANGPGVALWLDLADGRPTGDPVASAIYEGLQ